MAIDIYTVNLDVNGINERSLIGLFEQDLDFTENEGQWRDGTRKLGFKNEAERVSKELYEKHFKNDSNKNEIFRVEEMIKDVINTSGFIGSSSYYKSYDYRVIMTEYEYIVVIAYTTD